MVNFTYHLCSDLILTRFMKKRQIRYYFHFIDQEIEFQGYYCVTQSKWLGASLVALVVKNLPATAREVSSIPEPRRFPGVGNGNSSILAWEIPWTGKPSRLQSMVLQRIGHAWVTNTHLLCLLWIILLWA